MEDTQTRLAGDAIPGGVGGRGAVFGRDGMPVGYIGISSKFALLNRLITRDLNDPAQARTRFFTKGFNKEDILIYLRDPGKFERQLRRAVRFVYGASPHFRRLIQYFVGLSDLAYIVQPYKIDPLKANIRTTNINYRRVLDVLSSMNIKTQLPKILTVCLREDVFYGSLIVSPDCITIQQLPSDWCAISIVEGNVANVTFDFSYFDTRQALLDNYPEEFRIKYSMYRDSFRTGKGILRWIELDAPTSFAIKCNADILDFPLPPFAGILTDIFDIDEYKRLKLERTELENYAMVWMKIPLTDDGAWGIDLTKAKDFWMNLDSVLPPRIGSVLTPMDMQKISFERTHGEDDDTVAKAEQNLFSAAGVSSQLFNATTSANALLLSIKADQSITFGIVKSIEDAINRYIQSLSYGKHFKVTFLDCSPYNRKELGDAYLKAASYGMPTISMYAASQGLGQAELDNMSFLENDVMQLHSLFAPLQNSAQMPSDPDNTGGAPQKEIGELTDSGEQNREDGDDW